MFKKNSDYSETGSTSPGATIDDSRSGAARKGSTRSTSVIGPTLVFKGELSADEDLIIEGTIEGTIAHQQKNLVVGKQGRIKANIHAKDVTIEGNVEGDIRGDERVLLSAGANVSGNISSPRIHIADGAIFNGSVEMVRSQPEPGISKLSATEQPRARGIGT
jgi:cytoskeletal protein CcmA (bactofilin family)